jgi:cell division protein FtsI (penicillin-binding protein 3)
MATNVEGVAKRSRQHGVAPANGPARRPSRRTVDRRDSTPPRGRRAPAARQTRPIEHRRTETRPAARRTSTARPVAPPRRASRSTIATLLGIGDGGTAPGGRFTAGAPRRRLIALIIVSSIVLTVLVGRVFVLQTASASDFRQAGLDQRRATVTLRADRGTIFDRNGTELAMSVPATSIYADPRLVEDPIGTARALASVLRLEPDAEQQLALQLADRSRSFVYVQRLVSDDLAATVLGLGLNGIEGVQEPRRVNAAGSLGLGVVGTTDPFGGGRTGLELQYEDLLTGVDGEMVKELDNDGRSLPGGSRIVTPARPGNDLVLTLDRSVQHQVEQALLARVEALKARGGHAVVMTRDGQIRALASVRRSSEDQPATVALGNLAAVEAYEPGSVAKVFSMAAAIDQGAVRPDTTFVVPYRKEFDKGTPYEFTIQDAYPHPDETMSITDILVQSSNVGTIMAVERIGAERLNGYLRDFGFGEPTHLEFPGESPGRLGEASQWRGTERVTPSYGYGFSSTALQLVAAVNAVANDGVYVAPQLVAGTIGDDGSFRAAPDPAMRNVLRRSTARTMSSMMRDVVCRGTAELAQIPGMSVAGKTGTGYKVFDNGTYQGESGERKYFATFVGYFPADDPQVTILVSIDEPDPTTRDRFGGTAAAPVFADLAQVAIRELQIIPSAGDTGCPRG